MSVWEVRASIGGKPIYDPPRGDAQSSWFETGQGAHPGQGRVIVAARDWAALSTSETVDLEISSRKVGQDWPTTPTVSMRVTVRAALPWVQPKTIGADEGEFLELQIFDARYDASQRSHVAESFNMQKAGFPYVAAEPDFYAASLNASSAQWEWDELADEVDLTYDDFVFPTVKPRNISFSGCTIAEAQDRVAKILHAAISFDWESWDLRLVPFDTSLPENDDLWDEFAANPVVNSLARFSDLAYPRTLRFIFRVANAGGDPFDSDARWYDHDITTGYGQAGTVRAIEVGYWFGKDAGGTIFNAAELQTVAQYLFDAKILERYQTVGDVKNAGIWPFKPDGKYRRVLWVFDAHEISTTVRVNSDLAIRATQRAHELPRTSHVADAIGAAMSVATIDGRTHFDGGTSVVDEFDAIITDHMLRATNKWKYGWVSAVLVGDDFVRQSPPERSGSVGGDYAINGDETGNTATFGAGVKLNAPGFPAGMKVVAIGEDYTGALFDVHVRMRRTVDDTGATRYVFNRLNVIDGTCS